MTTVSTPATSGFFKVMRERGFIHQCSDLSGLDALARDGRITAYVGYDCTAPSLHVGSLISIMMLSWLQETGGKPIALIFWAPGFAWSQRSLLEMTAFLRKETPQLEVYAVSGRRDDQRDEEIQEAFALLDLPATLPLPFRCQARHNSPRRIAPWGD